MLNIVFHIKGQEAHDATIRLASASGAASFAADGRWNAVFTLSRGCKGPITLRLLKVSNRCNHVRTIGVACHSMRLE